jgi:hypothetical protein
MGHMKKYKCPRCLSTGNVIKYGYRNKHHRFFCKICHKHFSVNPCFLDKKSILSDHLDGLSFRKLASKYGISTMKAWRVCIEELKNLPNNNQFTSNYCSRFSNIFVFDGKYFNVADQEYDWVLLWGIDYFRHDIPIVTIAPSENYQSWAKYFAYFRIISHHPQLVVCDDNLNLKLAARKCFPAVRIQTCFNHFKENIRRDLKVRSDNTYKDFMRKIETVFDQKYNDEALNKKLYLLYQNYRYDSVCLSVLTNIERYKAELLGYRYIHQAPVTTNLVEGMNAHLEARLISLRSFQSINHARLWFNGYILKRRLTKFTDCRGKFRYLNGKCGVEMTKKEQVDLPLLF